MTHTLENGISLIEMDKADVSKSTWTNSIVFDIQAFKPSGKFYGDVCLVLEGYTQEQINQMRHTKMVDWCYEMMDSLALFLRYHRPFYKNMNLVVNCNCDVFFSFMIPYDG